MTWQSLSRLHIEAEINLLDSQKADPRQPLWGGKVDRYIDLSREMPGIPNATVAMNMAIERFTQDVLSSLPPRNPEKVGP